MATENTHTSNIQTERVIFSNIYVCVYKYEKTMTGKRYYKFEGKMEKAMNESVKGGKGRKKCCKNIIISKIKLIYRILCLRVALWNHIRL